MDEAILGAFLAWVDENEDSIDYNVMLDSCENSILVFTLDESLIKIDFKAKKASSSSKNKTIQKWVGDINKSLTKSSNPDFCDFIADMFTNYSDFKDFSSENEEENSDENYHEVIQSAIYEERLKQSHITGEVVPQSALGFYKDHFIFKEAEEAVKLLNTTLEKCPRLKYSLNIRNNVAFCHVSLEIDLAFLEIPDSVMIMLGLNYDSPLMISCSVTDIRLSQTTMVQEWTPNMLGFIDFDVMQSGISDSYGCKEYILGRAKKFRETMYKMVSDQSGMGNLLSLSRENSQDRSKSQYKALTKKLIDMNFPRNQVKEAVVLAQGNEELAIEYLNTENVSKYSGEYASDIITCNNFFYNMLFYLRDRIQNCTNYCFICFKRHVVDSYRLRPCSAEICEFRFEEISGISLYAEICSNPDLVFLDLSFASESVASSRSSTVFEPFPSFLLKKNQIRGKSGFLSGSYSAEMDSNKDIPLLRQLITQMPDINVLKNSCTDEVSCRDYILSLNLEGLQIYKLMRYIIATNRLNFNKLSKQNSIPKLNAEIEQYIVTSHLPETEKAFDNKRKIHGSFFAFHGSSIENWYSILRNGVRNLSNTHMMTAGAAYGAGVYAAENIATSFGYCRMTNSQPFWPYSKLCNPPKFCMGIIEVINNQKYNKGNGIYVIPEDKDLIIRYLLVFPQTAMNCNVNAADLDLSKHYSSIQSEFTKSENSQKRMRIERAIKKAKEQEDLMRRNPIREENKITPETENKLKTIENAFSGRGSTAANKRILQEYKYLINSKECKGLTAEFEGDNNMYVWIVHVDINKFEVNKSLKSDFQEYAKKYNRPMEMVFEMRFDSNYPFTPPFLRVIRPRFAFRTGHITLGGSICMQSITRSGWIPVRTVESIFIEILFNMAEGGARLDINSSSYDYQLAEAQEAFNRVARDHNWL